MKELRTLRQEQIQCVLRKGMKKATMNAAVETIASMNGKIESKENRTQMLRQFQRRCGSWSNGSKCDGKVSNDDCELR